MTGGYLALLAKCKYTFIDALLSAVYAKPCKHPPTDEENSCSSNMNIHIKNTGRPPVGKLCWWVNLLHCLCYSSIQGTNLILFHLQRSSGVRRWVALRGKNTHTPKSDCEVSVKNKAALAHTHQMKFQNKRLSCDLQFSSGPEKSEKTFQSVPPPLLCRHESAV